MNARLEVHRLTSRLDATLARGKTIEVIEAQADCARYFCILVSGLIERGAQLALMDYASRTSSPATKGYVDYHLGHFTNATSKKLIELFGRFDANWARTLATVLVDEKKDAIDSVIANRHLIAHGHSVGLSLGRIDQYYTRVQTVVEEMLDICGCP